MRKIVHRLRAQAVCHRLSLSLAVLVVGRVRTSGRERLVHRQPDPVTRAAFEACSSYAAPTRAACQSAAELKRARVARGHGPAPLVADARLKSSTQPGRCESCARAACSASSEQRASVSDSRWPVDSWARSFRRCCPREKRLSPRSCVRAAPTSFPPSLAHVYRALELSLTPTRRVKCTAFRSS